MQSFLLCSALLTGGLLESSEDRFSLFALKAEEIAFSAKLSDVNRKVFCYQLSPAQRQRVLEEAQERSPDASVAYVLAETR